ncbi:hypothetical protein HD597_000351 [Nonomuraea thailandensis]|uniref:Uncharacterized protein n=1 Tax=Nonomuraea thailandensis TaxID=1188745 RepID=A0A9X2G6S8_9ACTN|nr:hypothetical protein [Nonomuraea thailandensis]MCP2353331.1 hypothetical protein [Nonomuraea thailandensis]
MTVTRSQLAAALGRYLDAHPERAGDVDPLAQALADGGGGQDLASRQTLPLRDRERRGDRRRRPRADDPPSHAAPVAAAGWAPGA